MPSTAGKVRAPRPSRISAIDVRRQLPLIGGFLLLAVLAAITIGLFLGARNVSESANHTLQMRSKGFRLLTLVQDAETGQRGFLLSGDDYYLQPYNFAITAAPAAIAELQGLAAGSAVQTETLRRLKTLIDAKFAELAATVALSKKGDAAAALAIVKNNKGNKYMGQIRDAVGRFEAEEERSQGEQTAAAERNGQFLEVASLAAIATVVLLAGYTILATARGTRDLLKARDELRYNNENLEKVVAERVGELQVANDEIQRFAYIVSHDLRAPLVNVMGFTSELETARDEILVFLADVEKSAPALVTSERRAAIETDLPEALGFIRTSTAKMDRLINAILKLSREGRRVLTPEQIDLRGLVEAQGESLSQQLDAKQAALEVQADLPPIVSDKLAVEQIFGNLVENAVKYLSPDRPGRIAVSGRRQGAYVHYDVTDNGRGIEAKDFERVFELFRRSGEQNTQGEGIGLAYVRNLARRLGGNVAVRSEFGKGSTFTVTLPAAFNPKARAA